MFCCKIFLVLALSISVCLSMTTKAPDLSYYSGDLGNIAVQKKIGYVCYAYIRANGIWIEHCDSWWHENIWNDFKYGRAMGSSSRIVIFATIPEYRAMMALRKDIERQWREEVQRIEKEEELIYQENIKKVKQLSQDFHLFEGFRDHEFHIE